MYFIKRKYEPDVTVLKERLRHWFRLGRLQPEQGIALLIGLEPNHMCVETLVHWGENNCNDEKTLDSGVTLLHGCIICSWFQSGNHVDQIIERYMSYDFPERARTIFASYVYHHRQLLQYWYSDEHPERTSPEYFVKWARSKGLNPYWESVAMELGLILEEDAGGGGKQHEIASEYSAAWLNIQQAAIAQFFNPRRDYDAKRDDVVKWIKQRAKEAGLLDSDHIARSIFTIIKPANHNPKKKRIEPQ